MVEITIFEVKRIFGPYHHYPGEGNKEIFCRNCNDDSVDKLEYYKYSITEDYLVKREHNCPLCGNKTIDHLSLELDLFRLSIVKEIRKNRLSRIDNDKN